MKQIDEMFARFIKGQLPLRKKWQMRYAAQDGRILVYFFHYHHIICVFDCELRQFIYEWYEKPADERGLAAIKRTLSSDVKGIILNVAKEGSAHHELKVKAQLY